jgi:hypothetical protein
VNNKYINNQLERIRTQRTQPKIPTWHLPEGTEGNHIISGEKVKEVG